MVEHSRSFSTHSHNTSDSPPQSERYGKTRSRIKAVEASPAPEPVPIKPLVPKEVPDIEPRIKSEHLSVIDFDPSLLSVDFYCNYCNQALSMGGCRIRCAVCTDYDLCISCSCKCNYTEPHDLTHNYVPIGPNSFELFSEGWTADEELMLLEGISKYGFGNWKQVAELVNKVNTKMKTHSECENHYYEVYIKGTTPYPNVKNLRTPIKCNKGRDNVNQYYDKVVKGYKSVEEPDVDEKILSSEESGSHSSYIPPPISLLHSEPSRVKFFQNFTGYNIYRDELENEFNPDAEFMLKDMEFDTSDSPAELKFKVQLIELYNGFLDERIYRRRILMHKFWNDHLMRETAMQNMTELEKMLYWRLSPLLRFHSEEDHIKLTKLLIAKIELEKRLEIVQHWNSLGLRSIEDIQDFEVTKLSQRGACSKYPNSFTRISSVSNKIVREGVIHKNELFDYMTDLSERFCSEFYITRPHLEDILSSVTNPALDSDSDQTNPIIHIWDVHFEDFSLEVNKVVPNITKPPPPDALPEGTNLRVLLNPDKPEYDLSDISFENAEFNGTKMNTQQSNVLSQPDCHYYYTRFPSDRVHKVQKSIHKARRGQVAYSRLRLPARH